jgi:type IV pilus assembly protein PilW
MRTNRCNVRVRTNQRGLTLIEIMIALLIGVFILGALLTIVQANREVFGNQSQLAQMQDSERMAMSMITDVIQSAGYFPNPATNTAGGSLTAAPPFASGQAIYGTHSAAAPGDSISVRYTTQGGDNILNCSGQSNPVGGPNNLYTNTFQVSSTGPNAGQLTCTLTINGGAATTYNLVSGATNSSTTLGVTNLQILYGVKTSTTSAGNNVDTYETANLVSNWNNVISVQVALTFTNPLYAAGNGQSKTVQIQRVIDVMNQTGPVL